MSFSFYTQYPIWFTAFCGLTGLVYAFILYRREQRFAEASKRVRMVLPLLRFLAVTFISFFLLSPMLKHVFRTVEKPIVIIAQDNSESIAAGKDSLYYKRDYKNTMRKFLQEVSDKYDTATYSFGDKITPGLSFNYNEKQTDISSLFDEIETRFSNRNVGAVVLASDGLYNKGQNPVYDISGTRSVTLGEFPIYTIALGDTTVHKDFILSKIVTNQVAYFGNKFPVEIHIAAKMLGGNKATCTILKDTSVLFSQQIAINSNDYYNTLPVQLEAKAKGLQHYTVKLSHLEGEVSYANNTKDFFIDVLDGKENILILANAPHPDVEAIKNSLESNQNYEVTSALASDFTKPLSGFSVIVLHQIPSLTYANPELFSAIEKAKVPVLFILGSQSSVTIFNSLQSALNIPFSGNKINDAIPLVSKNFSLFALNDKVKKNYSGLSPVQVPFGNYKLNPSASVLFYQKIGLVETPQPLYLFSESAGKKIGIICGEGIWRWCLQEYAENKNQDMFNELLVKTMQYLSTKADKRNFRVTLISREGSRNSYYENKSVEFQAEVYNDSYELINTPDVSVTIFNAEGKKFPFVFNKTADAYRLDAGIFPVGNYRYEAKVKVGDKEYFQQGEFSVAALQAEATNTIADYQLLYAIAKKTGGTMVYPNQLNELAATLNAREDIKPISHSENKLADMINLKWVFFLLVSLVGLEWFVRKINGGY